MSIIGGAPPPSDSPLRQATVGLWSPDEGKVFCSGVLVAQDFLLTAAHCVDGQKSNELQVVFERIVNGKVEQSRASVQSFRRFKDDPRQLAPNFDIAWIRLASPAPRDFLPVEVISPKELRPGDSVTLAGFGKTSTDCEPGAPGCSGQLLAVESQFSRLLNSPLLFNLLVLGPTPGKTACNGDSGGPAFVIRNGRPRVLGVAQGFYGPLTPVSFPNGELKCEAGQILYTAIDDYSAWLSSAGVKLPGAYQSRVVEVQKKTPPRFDASLAEWVQYDNHFDENWFSLWETAKAAIVDLPFEEQGRILTSSEALAQTLGTLKELRLIGFSFDGKKYLRKVGPLGAMPSLEKIGLMGHHIDDITPLSRLHHLKSLSVTHNFDQEKGVLFSFGLQSLERVESLAELDLSFNSPPGVNASYPIRLEELRGVSGLKKLTVIDSFVNSLNGIETLGGLESLTVVDSVRTGKPRDMALVVSLRHLRELTLAGGPIANYPQVGALQGLVSLDMQRSGVSDLTPLSNLRNLQTLQLSGNPIQNLSPLVALPLQSLSLATTGLTPEACRIFGDRASICQFE